MITNKYRKIVTVNYEDSNLLRLKNIDTKPGNFYVLACRGTGSSRNLEYSLDGVNWTTYNWNYYKNGPHGVAGFGSFFHTPVRVNPGQNIYLRGINSAWGEQHTLKKLYMDVDFEVGGSPLSLLDYTDMESITTLPNYAFGGQGSSYAREDGLGLFSGITNLKSASKMTFLNVTTINNSSMALMFYRCSNLVDSPYLSNITTIGDYGMSNMFDSCTSLTTAPDLSSVTTVGDWGMQSMFNGCTVLANVPDMSSITTITGESQFRSMFQDCKAITTGPDMSGITVGQRSFINYMFGGCTALVTPPDLSNLTNGPMEGAREMFRGCTALTKGLDLKNVTTTINDSFMTGIYTDCYKLEEMTYPNISTWVDTWTGFGNNMGRDVAGTKTFYAPTGLVIPDGGIPTGWTRVDY